MRYAAQLLVNQADAKSTRFLTFILTEMDSPVDFTASVEVTYGAEPGEKHWTLVRITPTPHQGDLLDAQVIERTGRITTSLSKIFDEVKKGPISFLGEIGRSFGKHVVYLESEMKWVAVDRLKERKLCWRPTDAALQHHVVDVADEESARQKLARSLASELADAKADPRVKKSIAKWMSNNLPIESFGGDVPKFVSTADLAL